MWLRVTHKSLLFGNSWLMSLCLSESGLRRANMQQIQDEHQSTRKTLGQSRNTFTERRCQTDRSNRIVKLLVCAMIVASNKIQYS